MAEVKIIGQMDNTLDHTFESANRVYDKDGLCPTIPTCAGGGIQPKVIEETRCVGGLTENKWGGQFHQQDRVYKGDIALAQPANLPEGSYKYIVASRGRNPLNTNDRKKGSQMEQRLELKKDGCTNTITTVQKDNYVLEQDCKNISEKDLKIKKLGQISSEGSEYGTVISENGLSSNLVAGTHGYANNCVLISQATKEGSIKCKVGGCYDASYPDSKTRRGRVQEGGDITPTITAQGGENINFVETVYRIRKLTPRETWRLMGYTDEDFEKAAAVNSNTQLYKEAGNAIVKQVLMAIFSQML